MMLIITDSYIAITSIMVAILHEFGHLFFMYFYRDPPLMVELGAFGIRIEKNINSSVSYYQEAAGPQLYSKSDCKSI